MWQTIQAENVFNGDRFRLDGQRITFTAQGEAEFISGRVHIKATHNTPGGIRTKNIRLTPGSFIQVWNMN